MSHMLTGLSDAAVQGTTCSFPVAWHQVTPNQALAASAKASVASPREGMAVHAEGNSRSASWLCQHLRSRWSRPSSCLATPAHSTCVVCSHPNHGQLLCGMHSGLLECVCLPEMHAKETSDYGQRPFHCLTTIAGVIVLTIKGQ